MLVFRSSNSFHHGKSMYSINVLVEPMLLKGRYVLNFTFFMCLQLIMIMLNN